MAYQRDSSTEDLIAGCRRGERLAQKYLYERYYGKLMAVGMRYGGDYEEAVEIVNTAFTKIFRSWDKFNGAYFEAWAKRITVNTALDHLRRKNAFRQVVYLEDVPEAPVQSEALSNLQMEDLYGLLQQLNDIERSTFSLHVVEGYTYDEVAKMLGISTPASKWHVHMARKHLQKSINALTAKEITARS